MIQTQFVEKIKNPFFIENYFPRKSCRLWDNVGKYDTSRQATDDNVTRCVLDTKDSDTHSEYVIRIAFLRQQYLRERLSVLHFLSCWLSKTLRRPCVRYEQLCWLEAINS